MVDTQTLMMMMMGVVVVTILATPTVRAANIFSALRRGFEEQEEAGYTPIQSPAGVKYETRLYPERKWACSEQGPQDSDQMTVFFRLFAYIDGANDKKEKLVMGIPVSIEARGEGSNRVLQGCFFIPEASQANPPVPSDSRVTITTRPSRTVYSRRFGGFATSEGTWNSELATLQKMVQADGNTVTPALSFWNAYDPPLKFFSRRNEVWLVQA